MKKRIRILQVNSNFELRLGPSNLNLHEYKELCAMGVDRIILHFDRTVLWIKSNGALMQRMQILKKRDRERIYMEFNTLTDRMRSESFVLIWHKSQSRPL